MSNDHEWNFHSYITSGSDFEYVVTVPDSGEPEITIRISAVGGGTPGKAYAGHWYYSASGRRALGVRPVHGDDLYTGTPHTHAQAAGVLANILAQRYPEGSAEHDALTLFAEGALR